MSAATTVSAPWNVRAVTRAFERASIRCRLHVRLLKTRCQNGLLVIEDDTLADMSLSAISRAFLLATMFRFISRTRQSPQENFPL